MKRMIAGLLLGAVLLWIPFALPAQETDFSHTTQYRVNEVKVNPEGRTFFISSQLGEITTFCFMNYFDLDNVVHQIPIQADGGWQTLSLFGDAIAFGKVNQLDHQFNWTLFEAEGSAPVEYPVVSIPGIMSIVAVSQIDEEHSAVLFDMNGYYAVYYLDINANVIWSCQLPTTDGGLNDGVNVLEPYQFALFDSSHFVIIAGTSVSPTAMHVMKYNNTGTRTADDVITVNNPYWSVLSKTAVHGINLINYWSGGAFKVDKIDIPGIENVITMNNVAFNSSTTAVVADSTGITMFVNAAGPDHLKLLKFDWSGNILSQNTVFQNMGHTDSDCFARTPAGNYVCAAWGQGQPILRRVLASDFTVGNEENVNPPGSMLSVYPNPFRSNLTLSLDLKTPQQVETNIYNLKGQLIRQLNILHGKAGQNEINWDGADVRNKSVPNGMYLITARTGKTLYVKKCLKLDN